MNEQEILVKAKKYLSKVKINYESINEATYIENGKLRNNINKPVFMISFLRIFENNQAANDLCFLFIDSETFDLLYIMTSHGYIEIVKD